MLTTLAYRIWRAHTYAMEGSIFVAGAAIKWLRDGLKVIASAAETAALAASVAEDQAVYLVPAFVGLGAPHWDPEPAASSSASPAPPGPHAGARGAGVHRLPDP